MGRPRGLHSRIRPGIQHRHANDAWDASADYTNHAWDATANYTNNAWNATSAFREAAKNATSEAANIKNTSLSDLAQSGYNYFLNIKVAVTRTRSTCF